MFRHTGGCLETPRRTGQTLTGICCPNVLLVTVGAYGKSKHGPVLATRLNGG